MEIKEYFEGFDDKSEVCSNFNIPIDELKTAIMLHAQYNTPDYEGYADILYIDRNKLYEVHASHCSCYGLENQWDAEETFPEAAIKHAKFQNNPLLQALVNKEITIEEIYTEVNLAAYLKTHNIKESDIAYITESFKQNPDIFINPSSQVQELIENLNYPYLLLAHMATNQDLILNKLDITTAIEPN